MKFKKITSIVVTSFLAVSGILNSVGSIAFASNSAPTMTFKIVYETEDTIRADVMLENFPNFASGGFHIELGEGWDVVTFGKKDKVKILKNEFNVNIKKDETMDNGLFVYFAFGDNFDCNGKFVSFYVKKNDSYTEDNATINYLLQSTSYASDGFWNQSKTVNIGGSTSNPVETPIMYDTVEYIIGDVDSDGRVDATDASAILVAKKEAKVNSFNVQNISKNFLNYFPTALSPAAPDADQNGIINDLDAQAIMDYYSNVSTSNDYEGAIGSKDIYEFY